VKDEKVVNPPQNPTIKKRRKLGDRISLLEEMPIKNPIIKLPMTLTVKVPNGIEKKCKCKFSF
jgi:hypothetical protein